MKLSDQVLQKLRTEHPSEKFASFRWTVSGGKQAVYYGTRRRSGSVVYELVPVDFKGDKSIIRNEDEHMVALLKRDTGYAYVSVPIDDLTCPNCGESSSITSVYDYFEGSESENSAEATTLCKEPNLSKVCWSCSTFLVDATPKETE